MRWRYESIRNQGYNMVKHVFKLTGLEACGPLINIIFNIFRFSVEL